MRFRLVSSWAGLALLGIGSPRMAHGEPATKGQAEPGGVPASAPHAASSLAGFGLLATGGYGAATTEIGQLEFDPYAAHVGLDLGYTWPFGLRIGGYGGYGTGRTVRQTYNPLVGDDFELTSDTSNLWVGASIGFDVPLYAFVLRYTLGLGATVLYSEFSETRTLIDYDAESPTVGFHAAPGMAVVWTRRAFECGLGFDYFAQANTQIPAGLLGKLLIGVKL